MDRFTTNLLTLQERVTIENRVETMVYGITLWPDCRIIYNLYFAFRPYPHFRTLKIDLIGHCKDVDSFLSLTKLFSYHKNEVGR